MEQNYSKALLGTLKKFEKTGENNLVSGCRDMLALKENQSTKEVYAWAAIILFILRAEGPSGLVLDLLIEMIGIIIPTQYRLLALIKAKINVTEATSDEERLRLLDRVISFYIKCNIGPDAIGN